MANLQVKIYTVPIPQTAGEHADNLAALKFLTRETTEQRIEQRWKRMQDVIPEKIRHQLAEHPMAQGQLRHGVWTMQVALGTAGITDHVDPDVLSRVNSIRLQDVSPKETEGNEGLFRLKDFSVAQLRSLWKAPAKRTMTIRLATYDRQMSARQVAADWKDRGFQIATLFQKMCLLATPEGRELLPTIKWDTTLGCTPALVCLEPLRKSPVQYPILMDDGGPCLRAADGGDPGWKAGTRFVAVT